MSLIRHRLGWAIAITFVQIVFALCFASKQGGFGATYLRLLNWDSDHYRAIATQGYQAPCAEMSPDHSHCLKTAEISSDSIHLGVANVVFLPAYPLTARAFSKITSLSMDLSLLLVSQLCAIAFWFYFLLILEGIGLGPSTRGWAALAVAAHPAAFYLIVGYTESLFLALMLGYFYWVNRKGAASWLFALLHGALFCWARIVGVAVAAYPIFRNGLPFQKKKIRISAWVLFFLCLTSLIGFFAYSQYKFGNWALYFRLEETGWQNHKRWFALFNPLTYIPPVFFEDTIQSLNKLAVTFSAYLLITVGIAEFHESKYEQSIGQSSPLRRIFEYFSTWRGSLFIIAFGMFYIALTGKANSNLDSMLRYTYPSYILLVILIADLNRDRQAKNQGALFFDGFKSAVNKKARLKLSAALIFGIGFQAWCIYRFVHGHWVA